MQFSINGASSLASVDGVQNTISPGGNGASKPEPHYRAERRCSRSIHRDVAEAAMYPSNLSGANMTSINSNSHSWEVFKVRKLKTKIAGLFVALAVMAVSSNPLLFYFRGSGRDQQHHRWHQSHGKRSGGRHDWHHRHTRSEPDHCANYLAFEIASQGVPAHRVSALVM